MTGAPRRILILSASMGGGHMQVSRELERRFTDLGLEATVQDILALTPRWGRFLRWLYPWMVNRAPWLYDLVYRVFFLPEQSGARRASIPVRVAVPGLRRLVERERPDLVVSTYHLAGVAAARLRAGGELAAPAVTFVTTFGVHDLWIHPATDSYLCITPEAAARLSERTAAPVAVCEPVVRRPFSGFAGDPTSPLEPSRPHRALIVAGALGLGRVDDAVGAVLAVPGWTPVVVCGSNDRLRRELSGGEAEVHGWVDDMAALMAAADVVIDNAAGSTAKEALAVGCPVVTFRPIPGHGRHDALMMQEAGVGVVVDDAGTLAATLAEIASPGGTAGRVARGRALFGRDPARLLAERLETARAATRPRSERPAPGPSRV